MEPKLCPHICLAKTLEMESVKDLKKLLKYSLGSFSKSKLVHFMHSTVFVTVVR